MKRRVIQTITENNNTFGQVSSPQDVNALQDFLHERVNELTQDFINPQSKEIFGFNYTLDNGNALRITVGAPGRVYAETGKSYHLPANAVLNVAPAHPTHPRLDLIVAVLEDDVNTAMQMIPFVRLRTAAEIGSGTHYPPQNFNAPTERHHRAVVQVKTGTAAAAPVAPTKNTNEVPLYLVAVAPGALRVQASAVTDLRRSPLSLRFISDLINQHGTDIANLKTLVENFTLGDFGPAFAGLSLSSILNHFKLQIDSLRQLPEINYERPRAPLTDPATSKILAAGTLDNGVPTVEIEIGAAINFGDKTVIVRPEKFTDQTLNPRFKQIAGGAANDTQTTALTLQSITQIQTDGALDFNQKAAQFASNRSRVACAARDNRHIEIWAGVAANNETAIGEWLTYDTQNDTVTANSPGIVLPNVTRPCLISCGDGTHVLFIGSSNVNEQRRCFKVNCVTKAVTEITATGVIGMQFFGDLLAPGKIFIVGVNEGPFHAGVNTAFFEFDVATNVFTTLGTTGAVPVNIQLDQCGGCLYAQNEFVMVGTPVFGSPQTYIFNRTSLQWTALNIESPTDASSGRPLPISNFQMANLGGRPHLVGGSLAAPGDAAKSRVWELVSAQNYANYNSYNAGNADQTFINWTPRDGVNLPPVQKAGFCSTLVGGLPNGAGFVFAGQGVAGTPRKTIFAASKGGLIASTYNGAPAITLADSATFAQFLVSFLQADFDVAGYLMSLTGNFNDSNLLAEVSFDNGLHFHRVRPDHFLAIGDSLNPGKRMLRITLFNQQSSKPILSNLTEVFDADGSDLEERVVIAYNAPNAVKALYIDRDGKITLSATVEPSSPHKCLLHKVTPNGAGAPTVKNYINRRRPHLKYSNTKSSAPVSTQFSNELAVPARYVDARAFKADRTLYQLDDIAPAFDATVNVSGVATNGDTWIVELEG